MSIKNIVVLVKQVPNTNEIKIDQETGTLIRAGIPSIMNPEDAHGLEEALKIKEQTGATVTVVTMGPPQAKNVLIKALGMGADKAIHCTDRKFGGSDTLATSYTLAAAIKKLGEFDLIFAGREAIDGDTAQVGPQIAEHLGIPQVTYAKKIDINGNSATVERATENGFFHVQTELPALFTCIKELNKPRYVHIGNLLDAYEEDSADKIMAWGFDDLDLDETKLGLKGSPTKVHKSFSPTIQRQGEILEGSLEEKAFQFKIRLKEKTLI